MAEPEKQPETNEIVERMREISLESSFKVLLTKGKLPAGRAKFLSKQITEAFINHITGDFAWKKK